MIQRPSQHIPVLLEEVLFLLDPSPGDIVLDATAGGGGHLKEIARRILPDGKIIGIDKDPEAVSRLRNKFQSPIEELILIHGDYKDLRRLLEKENVHTLDAVLFDLGMSSFQVDDPKRGFSFLENGPLDMRFDISSGFNAWDIVNKAKCVELEDIIRNYGEERHAKLVARKICEVRRKKSIDTTEELKDLISEVLGGKYRGQKLHPAARTFQALRMCTNDELETIRSGIKAALDVLSEKGRIAVISFHSLEDRLVKNIFREMKASGVVDIITKKPVVPGREEVKSNPRARSAKLRVAEKV